MRNLPSPASSRTLIQMCEIVFNRCRVRSFQNNHGLFGRRGRSSMIARAGAPSQTVRGPVSRPISNDSGYCSLPAALAELRLTCIDLMWRCLSVSIKSNPSCMPISVMFGEIAIFPTDERTADYRNHGLRGTVATVQLSEPKNHSYSHGLC